jgi:hypothetical protein
METAVKQWLKELVTDLARWETENVLQYDKHISVHDNYTEK